MFRFLLLALLVLTPTISFANEPALDRREGFLTIWQSIRRPAYDTQYASFEDMSEQDRGYQEIVWAKRRKIIDDIPTFRPNKLLTLEDTLIWTYRTRNVAEITKMKREDLQALLEQFPIDIQNNALDSSVTSTQLHLMMSSLDRMLAAKQHEVSFYADDFHGQGTAFGEVFDMNALTAAHRTLPLDTLVKVTNVENGKHVVVRVNDRGPYAEGRGMDLSRAAFEAISPLSRGVLQATLLRLGDKDLVSKCNDEPVKYQKRIIRDIRFHRGVPHTLKLGNQFTLGSPKYFVVRWMEFPDGTRQRIESWIGPEEKFNITPSIEGLYRFRIGTATGRSRIFTMNVTDCSGSGGA